MLSKRHKITDPNFKKGDTIIGVLLTGTGQKEQIHSSKNRQGSRNNFCSIRLNMAIGVKNLAIFYNSSIKTRHKLRMNSG
jgi:hypothetical protein